MLRFIKHNLTTIDGVSIFPMISLLIFTIFFIVVLIRVVKMKKEEVDELSNLPIDSDDTNMIHQENSKQ
jgi:cytochrome c oxidase cbb3-type subunit IV